MISKKVLLSTLLIGLNLAAQERFPHSAPFKTRLKELNSTVKEKIEKSPIGDYAWLITAVGVLSGALYLYRTRKAYSKLSHHEFLQTRFSNLVDALNTYKEYINDLHFPPQDLGREARIKAICYTLDKAYQANTRGLDRLYSTVVALKDKLTKEQEEVMALMDTLQDKPHYEMLMAFRQQFIEYYGDVISTLEQLKLQIPYRQAALFIEQNHKVNTDASSLYPASHEDFTYRFTEHNFYGPYPLMAYVQDLDVKIQQVNAIMSRLKGFEPWPFQEPTLQKIKTAPQALRTLRNSVVASEAYASECRAYAAEQAQRYELERQRLLALNSVKSNPGQHSRANSSVTSEERVPQSSSNHYYTDAATKMSSKSGSLNALSKKMNFKSGSIGATQAPKNEPAKSKPTQSSNPCSNNAATRMSSKSGSVGATQAPKNEPVKSKPTQSSNLWSNNVAASMIFNPPGSVRATQAPKKEPVKSVPTQSSNPWSNNVAASMIFNPPGSIGAPKKVQADEWVPAQTSNLWSTDAAGRKRILPPSSVVTPLTPIRVLISLGGDNS